jgi:hypothetical protein
MTQWFPHEQVHVTTICPDLYLVLRYSGSEEQHKTLGSSSWS